MKTRITFECNGGWASPGTLMQKMKEIREPFEGMDGKMYTPCIVDDLEPNWMGIHISDDSSYDLMGICLEVEVQDENGEWKPAHEVPGKTCMNN